MHKTNIINTEAQKIGVIPDTFLNNSSYCDLLKEYLHREYLIPYGQLLAEITEKETILKRFLTSEIRDNNKENEIRQQSNHLANEIASLRDSLGKNIFSLFGAYQNIINATDSDLLNHSFSTIYNKNSEPICDFISETDVEYNDYYYGRQLFKIPSVQENQGPLFLLFPLQTIMGINTTIYNLYYFLLYYNEQGHIEEVIFPNPISTKSIQNISIEAVQNINIIPSIKEEVVYFTNEAGNIFSLPVNLGQLVDLYCSTLKTKGIISHNEYLIGNS